MSNQAAWLEAKRSPLKVGSAPMPKAGPGEVVIKNAAVSINPVDWKVQDYGIIIESWPAILGCDVAGEIYEVGEGVTNVKKGDRAMGHAPSLLYKQDKYSGFQLYTVCKALAVSRIPESLEYTSAVVLPISISTAAVCLFKKETLALPFPTVTRQSSTKSILVWGGSSSCGASAIQLAVAAGVTVISVASKHNLENVQTLGAKFAFDYNSPTVAEDIIDALKGTDFVGVCDCIGTEESTRAWTPVYKALGGRYGTVSPQETGVPEGIQGGGAYAPSVVEQDKDIGQAVWVEYIPEALKLGTFKAKPDPVIVGHGLESIQEGIDKLRKGVSYAKLVVAL